MKTIKLKPRPNKPRKVNIQILINDLSMSKQPGIELMQNIIVQNDIEGLDLHKIVRKTMEYFKLWPNTGT